MNRFPKSVLYLLKPQYKQSQEYNILTEKNIIDQFIVRGVNSLRIQFASRTNKENHIKRYEIIITTTINYHKYHYHLFINDIFE